jgi:hypothetical protein
MWGWRVRSLLRGSFGAQTDAPEIFQVDLMGLFDPFDDFLLMGIDIERDGSGRFGDKIYHAKPQSFKNDRPILNQGT